MSSQTPLQRRSALREALRDELATIRAINGALLSTGVQPTEYRSLTMARADALIVVHRILTQLHPVAKRPAKRREHPSCQPPNSSC